MVIRTVICVLFIGTIVKATDSIFSMPAELGPMCTAKSDSNILGLYVENVTDTSHVIHIQCSIDGDKGDTLHFQSLREHLRQFRNIYIFLQIRCSYGGEISLPWPMKAPGLIGLVVSNCVLTDKYADFGNPEISSIPDFLRVLEIRNSAWLNNDADFFKITNPDGLASLTVDYDCGQDSTIEYMVTSNVSFLFAAPSDTKTVTPDLTFDAKNQPNIQDFNQTLDPSSENKTHDDEFLNLLRKLESLKLQCNFEKLKLLDESIPQVLPVQHFALMVHGATYPELRVMNYSFSGIRQFPEELQDFRKYFPKLEFLDFSWNYLSEIQVATHSRGAESNYLTLDARHNLISNISENNITTWAMVEGVLVDIRDNPIHCGCGMQSLLQKIQSGTFFVGKLEKYGYIQEMICASPLEVKGVRLSEVSLTCGGDSEVSSPSRRLDADETVDVIVVSVVAAVAVVVAVLLVVIIVNIRMGSELFKRCIKDLSKSPLEKDAAAGEDNPKTKEVV